MPSGSVFSKCILTGMISVNYLYLQKVYGLVASQDSICLESILPGMISGFGIFGKYIAWYGFRALCHKNVYTRGGGKLMP